MTFCFVLAVIIFAIMFMSAAQVDASSGDEQLKISMGRKLMVSISNGAERSDSIGCAGLSAANCKPGALINHYHRGCEKSDHCRS